MGWKKRSFGLGSLLAVAIGIQLIVAATALAGGVPSTDPGAQPATTAGTVKIANNNARNQCKTAAQDEKVRAALAARVLTAKTDAEKNKLQAQLTAQTAKAAASAAACAVANDNAAKEAASLAGASKGPVSDVGMPAPLPDSSSPANHAAPTGMAISDNMQFLYNSRGTNGNFAGANFIHYENLGYDFMFADGTGGLSIWSLKNPAAPSYISNIPASALMRGADVHGPADTLARFYEGENPTVDSKRKLAFLTRDPRSFGNNNHPNGRTGLYIVDVKNPWAPQLLTYQWVPAGHTGTCINDCRYIWSVGPANNGSHVNGQPQDIAGALHPEWTGVPVFVTDVRDPLHPYTYAQPVDMFRNNNHTDYTHSVDVDQNGIAWTSGFGGVRGFWTSGKHHDPTTNTNRYATAMNPIPYAGGTITSPNLTAHIEHNSYHVTQAVTDHTSKTVFSPTTGQTYNKADLVYATQENVVSCTSTSGGGVGRFVVADLAGSYGGEDWAPTTTTANKFFITKLSDYSPKDEPVVVPPSNAPSASCSAHWFTVRGNMVAIAFYGQGIRVLDLSDPAKPVLVGYARIPSVSGGVQTANNSSAAYWHNGLIYVADYSRGVDVYKYTGPINGFQQPKICWNVCDK